MNEPDELAVKKIRGEGGCRVCDDPDVTAVAVLSRRYPMTDDRVLPLCPQHEMDYRRGSLNLMPHLTYTEYSRARADAGEKHALKRIQGTGVVQ